MSAQGWGWSCQHKPPLVQMRGWWSIEGINIQGGSIKKSPCINVYKNFVNYQELGQAFPWWTSATERRHWMIQQPNMWTVWAAQLTRWMLDVGSVPLLTIVIVKGWIGQIWFEQTWRSSRVSVREAVLQTRRTTWSISAGWGTVWFWQSKDP